MTVRELFALVSHRTQIPMVMDFRDPCGEGGVLPVPLDMHVSFRMENAELSEILSTLAALVGLAWTAEEYEDTIVIVFFRPD